MYEFQNIVNQCAENIDEENHLKYSSGLQRSNLVLWDSSAQPGSNSLHK